MSVEKRAGMHEKSPDWPGAGTGQETSLSEDRPGRISQAVAQVWQQQRQNWCSF